MRYILIYLALFILPGAQVSFPQPLAVRDPIIATGVAIVVLFVILAALVFLRGKYPLAYRLLQLISNFRPLQKLRERLKNFKPFKRIRERRKKRQKRWRG